MDLLGPPFSAVIVREGPETVLRLVGELDVASVKQLEPVLALLDERTAPVLVIDARNLDFIDSTGLRSLVKFAHAQRDGKVVVIPSRPFERLVEITGLAEVVSLVGPSEVVLSRNPGMLQ